jgi:hypothetical protein
VVTSLMPTICAHSGLPRSQRWRSQQIGTSTPE